MKCLTVFSTDSIYNMVYGLTAINDQYSIGPMISKAYIVGAILDPIPGTRNGQNTSPPSASRLICFRSVLFLQSQDEISLTGTLRYKPRPFPENGEGLVLEKITSLEKPSRLGTRQPEKCVGEMSVSIPREPMDEDMMDDVFKLAEALDAGFLDVQAEAATAVAGLTSDGETLFPTALVLSNKHEVAHYRDLKVFMCRSDIGQDMQETGSCSMYVYMVITYDNGKDQTGKASNPVRGQLSRESEIFPVPVRA